MFPQNLVEACLSQYQTVLRLPNEPMNLTMLADDDDDAEDDVAEDMFQNKTGNFEAVT